MTKRILFYFGVAFCVSITAISMDGPSPAGPIYKIAHKKKELDDWDATLEYQIPHDFLVKIQDSVETIPVGTILYHGTPYALPHNMPDMSINYFSFDINEARPHAIHRYDDDYPRAPLVYSFRVKKPIPAILRIDEKLSMKKMFELFAIEQRYHPSGERLGTNNELIALILKKERLANQLSLNGYSHRHDQNELELDEPAQYLQLVAIEEFSKPEHYDNPWLLPVENPTHFIPTLGGSGFQVNPVYERLYAPQMRSGAPAPQLARKIQRHEQEYKGWLKKVSCYLNKEEIFFGSKVDELGIQRDSYSYVPEAFSHQWRAIK